MTDQLVPSQYSARASWVEPFDQLPTAMHHLGDVHETPASELLVEPDGPGTVVIDQLVPVQTSAREAVVDAVVVEPTATHDVEVGQATLVSWLPVGLGAFDFDQLLPFQTSTMAREVPE